MNSIKTLNKSSGQILDSSIKMVADVMKNNKLTPGQKVTAMLNANEIKGSNESGINFFKAAYQFNGRLGS